MQKNDPDSVTKCAFTVATGKKTYKDMAVHLALSVARNSPNTPFILFTDSLFEVPKALKRSNFRLIEVENIRTGFSSKLRLAELVDVERSLFIDADCLVYRDLTPIFEAAQGSPVGVFGYSKKKGEFFCDVEKTCQAFDVASLPHFNGGLYYIERGEASAAVYSRALELEPRYDEIGLVRLRGQPNEEILMSISLAEHGIQPVANDGTLYADFQWWPQVDTLNVVRQKSSMQNPPPPHPLHQGTFPATSANPIVVHFLGHHAERPLYRRECLAVRLPGWIPAPDSVASVIMSPLFVKEKAREILRPAYRKLFGTRKVKESKSRLVIDE